MTKIDSKITTLIDRPQDRYLRGNIYQPVYLYFKDVQKMVTEGAQFNERTSIQPGARVRKPVDIILAIQVVWQKMLWRAISTDTDGEIPSAKAKVLLKRMWNCWPAGVMWRPEPRMYNCRKHMVCPWCRYRLGLWIIGRLEKEVVRFRYVARATLIFPLGEVGIKEDTPELEVQRLFEVLLNKRRCWDADVVITVPHFDRTSKRWMLRSTIIALLNDRERLVPLETLVELWRWEKIPQIFGCQWNVRECNSRQIMLAVADAVRYSPQHLRRSFKACYNGQESIQPVFAADILHLANLSERFRTRFHGLREKATESPV